MVAATIGHACGCKGGRRGLVANKRYKRVVQKAGVKPGRRGFDDEVTGGLLLCAPHPFLDKSGDSRPGKHSH